MNRPMTAVVTCLVFGIFLSGATAAAAAEAEFTIETASTGSGGASKAETVGGRVIESAKLTFETTPTSKKLGKFHIDFKEATSESGLATCTGTGGAAGEVPLEGEYHVVLVVLGGLHRYLLWFLVKEIAITCEFFLSITVKIRGKLLGIVEPGKMKTTKFELTMLQMAGKQTTPTEWQNDNTGAKESGGTLEASTNGTVWEAAALGLTGTKFTTGRETELIN
jgi:hypothetical protein